MKQIGLGAVLGLTFLLAVVSGVGYVVWTLGHYLNQNRDWVVVVDVPPVSELDQRLLKRFVDFGVVWPERSAAHLRLVHPACTRVLRERPENAETLDIAPPEAADPEGRRAALVRELCTSELGERVRAEIELFNSAQLLLAVRDNRATFDGTVTSDGVTCTDRTVSKALFPPPGCLSSAWEISVPNLSSALDTIAEAAIPVRSYVFLASASKPHMSTWAVVSPFSGQGGEAPPAQALRSDVVLRAARHEVQWIGLVESLTLGDKTVTLSEGRLSSTRVATGMGTVTVSVRRVCAGRQGRMRNCPNDAAYEGAPEGRAPAEASVITFEGNTSGAVLPVEILAQPGFLDPTTRLSSGRVDKESGKRLVGVGQITVACAEQIAIPKGATLKGGQDTTCDVTWRTRPEGDVGDIAEKRSGPFALTIEGQPILDENGLLTSDAFEWGYGDILGFGTPDPGSFAAVLRRQSLPDNFTLTVRPSMQALLAETLTRSLRAHGSGCVVTDSCANRTRADLVVLDAQGPDAGEILGFASLPGPGVGLSRWDLIALDTASPRASPFAANGFRAHDVTATPGSTFKIVTSLAAMQHVLDGDARNVEPMLMGTEPMARTVTRLGLVASGNLAAQRAQGRDCATSGSTRPDTVNALYVPNYNSSGVARCVPNAGDTAFHNATLGRCEDLGGGRPGIGVCEAMTKSSNLYYAGLALHLDGDKLLKPDGRTEHYDARTDLEMVQMAQRLFGRDRDLGKLLSPLDAFSPHYPFAARARPSEIVLDAQLSRPVGTPRRLDLAFSGMGQSVSASPLAMATIAASLAEGRVVEPRVVPLALRPPSKLPHRPILDAKGQTGKHDDMLHHLRRGMANVVTEGTARSARRASLGGGLSSKLFFKTGTAQITVPGFSNQKAAWVVGYVEPLGGTSRIRQRLAIACRVAPTGKSSSHCARIVGDLLEALHGKMP